MGGRASELARLNAELEVAIRLQAAGEVKAAEAKLRSLLVLAPPPQPALLARLARLLLDRGEVEEAEALAAQAAALADCPAGTLQLHAVAARRLRRLEPARASIERAVALDPHNAAFRETQGNVLADLGRWEAAAVAYEAARRLDPQRRSVLVGLALVRRNQGDLAACEALAREVIEQAPDHAGAQVELAMARLAQGDYRGGFKAYAWRLGLAELEPSNLPGTPWAGQPVAGRRILLYREQGLGDCLQFARFATSLRDMGAEVLLLVAPAMVALMRSLGPGITIVPEGAKRMACDYFAPLMSVPELLGLDHVPPQGPYLHAAPERVERWRAVVDPTRGFRIGVNWQGKATSKVDLGRSFPLAALADIARLPGVRLISLQKQFGLDQLAALPAGMVVEQLGPEFDAGPDAFVDTAAVMASLDLVLTSDTAVAHLAGALGRPTWVLLRHAPDWRWGMAGRHSPWYPTLRLFRQERFGDWSAPLAEAAAALRGLLPRAPHATPEVPVSWGELLDKLCILEIKHERIADPAKRANVARELEALALVRDRAFPELGHLAEPLAALKAVNEALWEIEDAIRGHEQRADFGPEFVALARAVYHTNDRRAALKRTLNAATGSLLVEEKSYAPYQPG